QLKSHVARSMREYSASVSHFDWNFARLMAKLRDLKLDKNTVVIFTSDHGYNMGHHGSTGKGNGDWHCKLPRSYHHPNLDKLPGIKIPNMWDTSLRPPHLIRWPGKVKANSTITEEINFIDFFPTLCEISGSTIPPNTIIRGRDFSALLTDGKSQSDWHNPLLIQHDTHLKYVLRGMRTKKWKIFMSFSHDYGFLYDLEKDPGEKKNLYLLPEYAVVRRKITSLLIKEMKKIGDPLFLSEEYPFSKSTITLPKM
ncbi:MAG: sulfatase-like hydrolase/transferase, partial [Lentisphaeraceae bacterium]|nr:sulfatase-like hydrolase/transferase [Lentisphaeraceae bacterium]